MIEHFFTAPAACGGTPFHYYVVPPPPSAGVGKFMEEKGTAPLHSLPTHACQVARELDSQGVDRRLRIQ